MPPDALHSAITSIPPGGWAVGVSGGADSVALLSLLRGRTDLGLHVVHLDHQLRGQQSDEDARFVAGLAGQWALPYTIARRADIEPQQFDLPANPSARYRALRLALFQQVVEQHQLRGVILAHHADDQAETILQRLLRGSGPAGLGGMGGDSAVGPLRILRPLLPIRRQALRDYLREAGQPWREDESNSAPKYLRNQLRTLLSAAPALVDALLALGQAMSKLNGWADESSPRLPPAFDAGRLADLPAILAEPAARRWLIEAGCPQGLILPAAIAQLRQQATDAATPAREHFPGGVQVRRRAGKIIAGR